MKAKIKDLLAMPDIEPMPWRLDCVRPLHGDPLAPILPYTHVWFAVVGDMISAALAMAEMLEALAATSAEAGWRRRPRGTFGISYGNGMDEQRIGLRLSLKGHQKIAFDADEVEKRLGCFIHLEITHQGDRHDADA